MGSMFVSVPSFPTYTRQEFEKDVFYTCGLVYNPAKSLQIMFETDAGQLIPVFIKGRPLCFEQDAPALTLQNLVIYDPLNNVAIMKTLFDMYLDLIQEYPTVVTYAKVNPKKRDIKGQVQIVLDDGRIYSSGIYYNDSLKYMDCINYLCGYDNSNLKEIDFTQAEMEAIKERSRAKRGSK